LKISRKAIVAAGAALTIAAASLALLRHRPSPQFVATQQYADPATCIQCHATEAAGYARSGMAHAFYIPTPNEMVTRSTKETQYYHAASGTYYELTQHDGKFFQRRWQKGFDGKPDNVEELPIDYIMGSGNHVRTYLHRDRDGTLIELPMAWYSEAGGHLGMNPGFDNAQPMTRRPIAYECMFCHNAYPQIPPTAHRDLSANAVYAGELPQGIDCQRCHGPGVAHVKAAQTAGISLQEIRARILNPARLSNDRKMEICEQCHLETTSRLLPDRIRHYDQTPFTYNPTQPLSAFNSYFNRDPAKGRTDNFEIVSAPYRLRQSQCYLKSRGALTCETCHNPHDLHKGPQSAGYYTNICLTCHGASLPQKIVALQHTAATDCISCHMPQRRTEDVVHAVMTDHLIQRLAPPAKVLLAERAEISDTPATAYRGPVKRYLLDHETPSPSDALYDASAQVIDGSNLDGGIPALSNALDRQHPAQPNFYIELGDARRHAGDLSGAIAAYRRALTLDPLSSRSQRRLGVALGSAGQTIDALTVLHAAIKHEPDNALLWYEQALIELRTGASAQGVADLREALQLKPAFADAQNSLGSALAQSRDAQGAEAAFRAALAINPYDSGTRANLGRLLAGAADWRQAAFQLAKAVRLDPANAQAHGDYAAVLLQLHQFPAAETEARAALALDPNSDVAQLDLAVSLIQQNQPRAALAPLEKAVQSHSPEVAAHAHELLDRLKAH
jgi:Flp pilus assembly protein TadD